MVERLQTDYVDIENGEIYIPAKAAVKNDESWTVGLSERSVRFLEKWLYQRENKVKYDDNNKIWLNRSGNPYTSANLNNLLNNLLEEAIIKPGDRKITWHSIRHSTGMYIYESERDLGLVAEILRHKSIETAQKHPHPTTEMKKDVVEASQGGAGK
jgi:site-specific recombinase XerD